MGLFNRTPLTPEQEAARAREKAQRARESEERRVRRAELERERFEKMSHFVVRQTREVTVKAENMTDAIALASAAFKEGQDSDFGIKWRKPFGTEGDTVDEIRITNIKAVEEN